MVIGNDDESDLYLLGKDNSPIRAVNLKCQIEVNQMPPNPNQCWNLHFSISLEADSKVLIPNMYARIFRKLPSQRLFCDKTWCNVINSKQNAILDGCSTLSYI